ETWYERFTVELSNPTYDGPYDKTAAVSQLAAVGTVTILDDEPDPLVTITANAAEIVEGTGGTTRALYTITRTDSPDRDGSLNVPTTVRFEVSGLTGPNSTNPDYRDFTTSFTIDGVTHTLI